MSMTILWSILGGRFRPRMQQMADCSSPRLFQTQIEVCSWCLDFPRWWYFLIKDVHGFVPSKIQVKRLDILKHRYGLRVNISFFSNVRYLEIRLPRDKIDFFVFISVHTGHMRMLRSLHFQWISNPCNLLVRAKQSFQQLSCGEHERTAWSKIK